MHFSIYLDDKTGQRLNEVAKVSGKSHDVLIRDAIELCMGMVYETAPWPEDVMTFQGMDDFPPFENHRTELLPASSLSSGDSMLFLGV